MLQPIEQVAPGTCVKAIWGLDFIKDNPDTDWEYQGQVVEAPTNTSVVIDFGEVGGGAFTFTKTGKTWKGPEGYVVTIAEPEADDLEDGADEEEEEEDETPQYQSPEKEQYINLAKYELTDTADVPAHLVSTSADGTTAPIMTQWRRGAIRPEVPIQQPKGQRGSLIYIDESLVEEKPKEPEGPAWYETMTPPADPDSLIDAMVVIKLSRDIGGTVEGRIFTIDPETNGMVLQRSDTGEAMWLDPFVIESVERCSGRAGSPVEYGETLTQLSNQVETLLRDGMVSESLPSEHAEIRSRFLEYLKQRGMPASTPDGVTIEVMGVTMRPPFNVQDMQGDNPVVLDRLYRIVDDFKKQL